MDGASRVITPSAISIILWVLSSLIFLWTFCWIMANWMKCKKCELRIPSVKIQQYWFLDSEKIEALGWDGRRLVGEKVCSKCWEDDLKDLPFEGINRWGWGTVVEYVKNTPAFLALMLSAASLTFSILLYMSR